LALLPYTLHPIPYTLYLKPFFYVVYDFFPVYDPVWSEAKAGTPET